MSSQATNYTLTYNEDSQGWPSFYSFYPEFIIGMNAYLYTFSGVIYTDTIQALFEIRLW